MEDWRRYLVQLETAGIIYGGILARPTTGYVKTNGWTYDQVELEAIRSAINTGQPGTKPGTKVVEVIFLTISELFDGVAEDFFSKIQSPDHCLHSVLPEEKTSSLALRPRGHQ